MKSRTHQAAVLGIDAAWTERQPSGVALIQRGRVRWQCVTVAGSYREFLGVDGDGHDRSHPWPGARMLLGGAGRLVPAGKLAVVAIDMPLALSRIIERRHADSEVSRRFGAAGCATHSPSASRPGPLADRIRAELVKAGLPLATCGTSGRAAARLIEVYPHPAVMALCGSPRRVPYKVSKLRAYWPDLSPAERMKKLRRQWADILAALRARIDGVELTVPKEGTGRLLKAFEDKLDALVCAWVGAEYIEGRARAYGDANAAIWIPQAAEDLVVRSGARTARAFTGG